MLRLIFAPALAVIACVSAAGLVSAASLSLTWDELQLEGNKLSVDAIFARVDSLMDPYYDARGDTRARLARRLGELHLSTDMFKHRRTGLEYLDESMRLRPDLDLVKARAVTVHRMRYPSEATKTLDRAEGKFGDEPLLHGLRGRYHFIEARRVMDADGFERSRQAFERSIELNPDYVDGRYGLAAALLALERYERLAEIAPALLGTRRDVAARFLLGAVASFRGEDDEAQAWFRQALDSSPLAVRAAFEDARWFLDEHNLKPMVQEQLDPELVHAACRRVDAGYDREPDDDPDVGKALQDSTLWRAALDAFWKGRDDRPTQLFNPQQMGYWRRLVEADILFGDPESGRPGWKAPMGTALVRWGRPTSTMYESGGAGGVLQMLEVAGAKLSPSETFPSWTPLWVWTYHEQSSWFSLLFVDETRNGHWTTGWASSYAMESLKKNHPLVFFEPKPEPTFRLFVDRAVFARGPLRSTVETYVALLPTRELSALTEDGSAATASWAVFDAQNRRIDYVEVALDASFRRDHLRYALSGSVPEADAAEAASPYLLTVPAALDPGKYRIAVEVVDGGGGRQTTEFELVVPAVAEELALSDLQVLTARGSYDAGASRVPVRFVKYGEVVLPAATRDLPANASQLSVYYELYQPGLDVDGRTRLNVHYEVFRLDHRTHWVLERATSFRRQDLSKVEPVSVVFVEERTGRSSLGHVVKGTDLPIDALASGNYLLVVTVEDLVSRKSVSQTTAFRKLAPKRR